MEENKEIVITFSQNEFGVLAKHIQDNMSIQSSNMALMIIEKGIMKTQIKNNVSQESQNQLEKK